MRLDSMRRMSCWNFLWMMGWRTEELFIWMNRDERKDSRIFYNWYSWNVDQ
jgi:hypothetical protein